MSAAGAVAAALLILLPISASAHSELQSSNPAQGTVVPSPFSGPVVMTFTESLAVGSKADLYGPGHQLVASATIDAGTMTVSLTSPLAPGDYTVEWVSIADDGDLLRGTIAFSVATASGSSASAAPSAPSSGEPSVAATNPPSAATTAEATTPAASATSSSDTGGTGSDVILPIVIVLIVAAAGAFYLVRRNRPA